MSYHVKLKYLNKKTSADILRKFFKDLNLGFVFFRVKVLAIFQAGFHRIYIFSNTDLKIKKLTDIGLVGFSRIKEPMFFTDFWI